MKPQIKIKMYILIEEQLCLLNFIRQLRGGLVSWEIIKAAFLCRFFLRDMREEKVTEFINLRQGGKSVHEYSLEYIKLSKYAPSLVSDPRDQMIHFFDRDVGGVTRGVPIGYAT